MKVSPHAIILRLVATALLVIALTGCSVGKRNAETATLNLPFTAVESPYIRIRFTEQNPYGLSYSAECTTASNQISINFEIAFDYLRGAGLDWRLERGSASKWSRTTCTGAGMNLGDGTTSAPTLMRTGEAFSIVLTVTETRDFGQGRTSMQTYTMQSAVYRMGSDGFLYQQRG